MPELDSASATATTTTPPAAGTDASAASGQMPPAAPKYAGKYATESDLENGFKARYKLVHGAEWDPAVKLVGAGDDAMYASHKALERQYNQLGTVQARMGATAKDTSRTDISIKAADTRTSNTAAQAAQLKGDAKILAAASLTGKEKELGEHWVKHGHLAPEHYAAFEKAGRDREEVDARMAGETAKAQLLVQRKETAIADAAKIAGGQDQLAQQRDWAANRANTDPTFAAALERWNKRCDPDRGGDVAEYPDMIDWIGRQYAINNGTAQSRPLVQGGTPTGGGASPAASVSEFNKLSDEYARTGNPALLARMRATPLDILQRLS